MKRIDCTTNEFYEGCHNFQVRMCERFGKPVLNVACQDDPAFLGEKFDAINLDRLQDDIHLEDMNYARDLKNFHNLDARQMPADWADRFATTVLGEFLEHVTEEYALEIVSACVRATKPGGVMVFTFPHDHRKPEEQHDKDKLYEAVPGYTTYHRTIWTDEMLERLFKAAGLKEILRGELTYLLDRTGKPMRGLGLVARRV
jgi:2-polyprenyl-3-methyl-5-hydroxy-6-metoxy-1,4-benzoquinol methylase